MELLSNTKPLSALNTSEGNDDLLVTGYNSLANDDTRASRDFYLLLIVYVKYFCLPVLSFIFNGMIGIGKGIQNKFAEKANVACMPTTILVEDEKYICKLPFSHEEQVEYIFLSKNLYQKNRVAIAWL